MKTRTLALVPVIASLVLATLACQVGTLSVGTEENPAKDLRVEEGGFAFTTIPHYEVNESSRDMGSIRLNPDDIDWGADDYSYEEGPLIDLCGFVPTSGLTIEEYQTNTIEQMDAFYQAVFSDQGQVFVAGLAGVAYNFDYELSGIGRMKLYTVIVQVSPTHFWEIRCSSKVEKWDKTLADCQAAINSVTFFEISP